MRKLNAMLTPFLVMMRIDHVNAQKDELTTAVKALADTAKQLVSVVKRVGELEKNNAKC